MLNRIVETCLYAKNLHEIKPFYSKILGLKSVMEEPGRHIFFKCGDGMLLIFNPERTSSEQSEVNGNPVPLHGTKGAGHVAFSVDENEFETVKNNLLEAGVQIESEIEWPNNSRSFYFRDPAYNSLEIVTGGLWNFG
ncbi:MAG: VOC family protein [Balneolaceae bacterium]